MLPGILEIIFHVDTYINVAIQNYGIWIYLIMFLIIFIETGLVFVPFLPGDSLLFVAGAFAAIGSLNFAWLFGLLALAAILGDTVNYWIGNKIGHKGFHKKIMKYVKYDYLKRSQNFYDKHGGKTIIIARFIPFIRTFAPFVAGMGTMKYRKFISYNIIGGLAWVFAFLTIGFYFGNMPIIKNNFGMVLSLIIILSIMAGVVEVLRHRTGGNSGNKILSSS